MSPSPSIENGLVESAVGNKSCQRNEKINIGKKLCRVHHFLHYKTTVFNDPV